MTHPLHNMSLLCSCVAFTVKFGSLSICTVKHSGIDFAESEHTVIPYKYQNLCQCPKIYGPNFIWDSAPCLSTFSISLVVFKHVLFLKRVMPSCVFLSKAPPRISLFTQETALSPASEWWKLPQRHLAKVKMKNRHLSTAARCAVKTSLTPLNSSDTYAHTQERGLSPAPCARRGFQRRVCS